jgi:hypothetical protein
LCAQDAGNMILESPMSDPNPARCGVVELRQYTLHPGRRHELITLFEREFIHTQAAVGAQVLGIFEDADRAERFVWLRGFADMAARGRALAAFYDGPAWRAHCAAANATMVDSDDVLLLRPLTPLPGPANGATAAAATWHVVVCPLAEPCDAALAATLRAPGAAWLETDPAPNNFPRLPVRSDASVVVGLAAGPIGLPDALRRRLAAPAQALRLHPTARSPLR